MTFPDRHERDSVTSPFQPSGKFRTVHYWLGSTNLCSHRQSVAVARCRVRWPSSLDRVTGFTGPLPTGELHNGILKARVKFQAGQVNDVSQVSGCHWWYRSSSVTRKSHLYLPIVSRQREFCIRIFQTVVAKHDGPAEASCRFVVWRFEKRLYRLSLPFHWPLRADC